MIGSPNYPLSSSLRPLLIKLTSFFAVIFFSLVTSELQLPSDDFACTGDGIYLYEDSNFGGGCRRFTQNHQSLADIGFDDVVSSVRFVGEYAPWHYRITLCEEANYIGTCSPLFTGDDLSIGDKHIDHDRTSSLIIEQIEYHDSVRIGTYNAQSFDQDEIYCPAVEACHDGCCEDIASRHSKLAERIIAGNYDIFILNELFEEDARDILISRLREYYPHYVEKMDDGGLLEDSGLMLFSRLSFLTLPMDTYRSCDPTVQPEYCSVKAVNGEKGFWYDVAFLEFTEIDDDGCNGELGDGGDCMANKGVGYVRIWNPLTERVYNVLFTHMDAGSEDEDELARRLNLEATEAVIRGTITPDKLASEDIFFLGDLNINGDHAIPEEEPAEEEKPTEWESYFKTTGSFFTEVLQDVWHYQITRIDDDPDDQISGGLPKEFGEFRDRGLTSDVPDLFTGEDRKRLDYFIHNKPDQFDNELCVQQISIAYNLRHGDPYQEATFGWAGFQDLSDHYGVNADLNRRAPHCSPGEAIENPPEDTLLDGVITYPGSVQWYRIDPDRLSTGELVNGTYSIEVRGNGPLDYQVFKSSNLSAPLPRASGDASSWTYTVPLEPFYIRVFSRDRNWEGGYQLFIHQHKGTALGDAIVLHPNQPYPLDMDKLADKSQPVWFQIDTEAPYNGTAQTLRFFARSTISTAGLLFELRSADGLAVIDRGDSQIERRIPEDNDSRFYLLVKPDSSDGSASVYQVGWETNLWVLHGSLEQPLRLIADNTTEGGFGNDDDISTLKIRTDDNLIVDTGSLGDFDDNQIRNLDDVISPIRFLNDLQLELIEDDPWIDIDGNDHLYGSLTLSSLNGAQSHLYHRVAINETFQGVIINEYFMDITLAHGLPIALPSKLIVVKAGRDKEIFEDTVVSIAASFIDSNIPSVYAATIDWGDGLSEAGRITETDGRGLIEGEHVYNEPGRYIVTVTITDDSGSYGSDQLSVLVIHGFLQHSAFGSEDYRGIQTDDLQTNEMSFVVPPQLEPPSSITLEPRVTVIGSLGSKGAVDIGNFAVITGDVLSIESTIEVQNEVGIQGDLVAESDIQLGAVSQIDGNITAGGNLTLQQGSSVTGDVTVGGEVSQAENTFISGTVTDGALVAPPESKAWVDFSVSADETDIIVNRMETIMLEPDEYGGLVIGNSATVRLVGGTYEFGTVEVGTKAAIHLDLTQGPVIVYVDGELRFSTDIEMSIISDQGEATDVLFLIKGGQMEFGRDSSYLGTFLGPRAAIEARGYSRFEGALYGTNINIGPKTIIDGKPAVKLFVSVFL